jgi:hypothetical protein
MYRYKKRDIFLQSAVGAMFIVFGIMLGNWVYLSILGFFSILLFKDSFKQLKTEISVLGDRIEVRTGEKVTQVIYYKDFQFITRTRRHKKWIVLGHGRNIFYIRPSIERYQEMTAQVLKYNQTNKKVFIHRTLENYKFNG